MRYECFVNDLSSLHILAASTLAGDSVFGSASIDITATWNILRCLITWFFFTLSIWWWGTWQEDFFYALNRTPPLAAAFIPKGVGTRGVENAYTHLIFEIRQCKASQDQEKLAQKYELKWGMIPPPNKAFKDNLPCHQGRCWGGRDQIWT